MTYRTDTTMQAEALGVALRERITALGLTQAEVARRCGLAYQTLHGICWGKRGLPSWVTIARIATVIDWSPTALGRALLDAHAV